MMRSFLLALIVLSVAQVRASASQADCGDYTKAVGEDRALFNGFIYGYVSAVIDSRNPTLINEITLKVRREVDKYCIMRPADSPNSAVAVFARAEAYALRHH